MTPQNFALIGVAGYIAPRHLQAIKDTGNILQAAVDPHDSVGIIDGYFPNTRFFTEFERFDRFVEKSKRNNPEEKIDYVSICSPNYLHDAHIRFAFRAGANAICEKPLVLNPWNLDALEELEKETGKSVSVILQLRLHPALVELKEKLSKLKDESEVELTYVTPRGPWYLYSWKGLEQRSGGLMTNIGIHLFDLLLWFFGDVETYELHQKTETKCSGFMKLNRAKVKWFLSIDNNDLPRQDSATPSYRSLTINGESYEFSDGFTELHTTSYKEILAGNSFKIKDARPSIELVYKFRNAALTGSGQNAHPLLLGK